MGSIVIQPQHDPVFGTVDAEEADSSDTDMQALGQDVFDLQGGLHVDPKDEYGQKMLQVPVSVQGSLDQGRYERHRATLGMVDNGRPAKGMIVIGPTFAHAGAAFGDSGGMYPNPNPRGDKNMYDVKGENNKSLGMRAGFGLVPSTYWIEDQKIKWVTKHDKEGDALDPLNVGQAAYDALSTYLDSRDGEGNHHKKITIQDTASLYDFHRAKFNSQIKSAATGQDITFNLSDVLIPSWFSGADDAASMVALVRFGFLKDAKIVDIMNQQVTFATADAAETFVNKLFGVDKRTTLGARSDGLANGAQATTGQRPENIDQTYTTPGGEGLHFWFYEGEQVTTSVRDNGIGTQDNVIWSIAAYDDVRHAVENPVEFPVSYDGLTSLDEVPEERRHSGIILPILVPDESTEPVVYDKAPELFTSAERSLSGKSPIENFQIPPGWRLPTQEELTDNLKSSSTVRVPDKPGFNKVPITDEYGREIDIEKYVNFYTMPTPHGNLMPVVLVEIPDEILEKIAVFWSNNKDSYLANAAAQLTPMQIGFIAVISLSAYVGYRQWKQSRPDSTADVVARRESVFKEGLVELSGERFVAENNWYDEDHSGRVNEVRNLLEYYYQKVNNSGFSERQGALVGNSGTGKDVVMEMAGIGLRLGYYSDGTPVEQRYLNTFGDTMYVNPARVIAAEFRQNYDMSAQANLEAALSLAREYHSQTGKHTIVWIPESYTGLKMLNLARGQGEATYAYDIVFKTEKRLCIAFLMTPHGDAGRIGGADGFYSSNGGSNSTEMKRRVPPITLTGPPETVEQMRYANTNAGASSWDANDIDSRKLLEPGMPGRVTPPPASRRPIEKVKFDPRKITVGKNAGLLRRAGQGIASAGRGIARAGQGIARAGRRIDRRAEERIRSLVNPPQPARRDIVSPETRAAVEEAFQNFVEPGQDLIQVLSNRNFTEDQMLELVEHMRASPDATLILFNTTDSRDNRPLSPLTILQTLRSQSRSGSGSSGSTSGSSGPGGTGSPPPPSGSPPPAPRSSAPPGSSTSSANAATFAPKLTLAELAQIFPQLRQPFANPQIAVQAITQNLTEAQRMIWKQRICPEGLPLPQSSYEIAARLQKVVGEQNAQMIFARTLFFCRSGTVSSPALGVMLMNAAVLDPRSLSDPVRAVDHAEQIVKNYERLIEERRGRGEKVEEEARRVEAWRRELERQKQQRERAVAVPL